MKRLKANGVEVLLYEPILAEDLFFHTEVVRDLDEFKERCDVIVANQRTQDIVDVEDKVYTCDLFGSD
jgi:UDPglucose 6-dehydrogenase